LPELEELYQEHKASGLVVIGVATTTKRDPVQAVISEEKISFPIFLDEYHAQVAFDNTKVPESLLISRDGVIIERIIGGQKKAIFEDRIKNILAK